MSAQGFRVLRRLEGWGFGGRRAVSAQGLRVLRRLEGGGFSEAAGVRVELTVEHLWSY